MVHQTMSLLSLFEIGAVSVVPAIFLAACILRYRDLSRKAAVAQLEASRLRRHTERLEMVLKQAEPELFAQVKARSDMEWQQAVKRLDEGELPTFYDLETSFTPITPVKGAE
jgi:hypothetical protein